MPTYEYAIEIGRPEFTSTFQSVYDECIDELKMDDAMIGEYESPYPGAKDYPRLEEFVDAHSEYFYEFVDTFLMFKISSHFF